MKIREPKPPTITVSIAPYGRMKIVGEEGDDGLALLKHNWASLWPAVKRDIERMRKNHEAPVRFETCKWMADGHRLEPDVFMSDQADLFLRIRLEACPEPEDALPVWDFFIKGTDIVHCQPVY